MAPRSSAASDVINRCAAWDQPCHFVAQMIPTESPGIEHVGAREGAALDPLGSPPVRLLKAAARVDAFNFCRASLPKLTVNASRAGSASPRRLPRLLQRNASASNSQHYNWPRCKRIAHGDKVGTSRTSQGDNNRRADSSAWLASARHSPPVKQTLRRRLRRVVHISYGPPYGFGLCDQICNLLDAGCCRVTRRLSGSARTPSLAFRGGENDMTRVNEASIEGQRKSSEKSGI
jgi:hypothetical protein